MSRFTKQMFMILVLVLLCFGGSLAMTFVSIINQPCMVRPALIDLNPDELQYYPFINSMSRCNESCNTVEYPVSRT